MIGLGAKYLTAAGFGRYRITAASLGSLDLLGTFSWLTAATKQAIMAAFGVDGPAVIRATNEYLTGIAASDMAKATALAALINEDPMMVCSLGLEPQGVTMPVRWLVGDGNSWIDTGLYATQDSTAKAKTRLLGTSISIYQCIFGARVGAGNRDFEACFQYPDKLYFGFSNSNIDFINIGALGTIIEVELSKYGGWVNGTKKFASSQTNFRTPNSILLFSRTDDGAINTRPLNGALLFADFGGDLNNYFVPFKSTTREGMVDIANGTFHPNQGTGHFSVAYTKNGQPWTPPTP